MDIRKREAINTKAERRSSLRKKSALNKKRSYNRRKKDRHRDIYRIYTDGACDHVQNCSGWACIIIKDNCEPLNFSGSMVSNNSTRVEMTAIIKALKKIPNPSNIHIYTDCLVVVNGMKRQDNCWDKEYRALDGSKIKNQDLWITLGLLARMHNISWHYVKAHDGNFFNEEADKLAREKMTKLRT
ncbi:MAG: ribonuclease H [Nitrosopumilaceae archaeon]